MAESHETVHHPIIGRLLPRIVAHAAARGQSEHRRELLAGLSGGVVEVGAGTGVNFAHYAPSVTQVVAIEPEGHLRDLAARAARGAPVPARVIDGIAERLPVEDESFDAGVASLVLCSVRDPARALAELFRVIRPGGELRFYEHVLAESPGLARAQRTADKLFWPRLGGGCHCSRDTASDIEKASFVIEQCRRFSFSPSPILFHVAPHVLGKARRP